MRLLLAAADQHQQLKAGAALKAFGQQSKRRRRQSSGAAQKKRVLRAAHPPPPPLCSAAPPPNSPVFHGTGNCAQFRFFCSSFSAAKQQLCSSEADPARGRPSRSLPLFLPSSPASAASFLSLTS
jgi:hypothetical protein